MTHSSCEEKVSLITTTTSGCLIVIATAYINKSQSITVYVVVPQWHAVDWSTLKEHYFKNLLFQENKNWYLILMDDIQWPN